jgi:competence protein ComEC
MSTQNRAIERVHRWSLLAPFAALFAAFGSGIAWGAWAPANTYALVISALVAGTGLLHAMRTKQRIAIWAWLLPFTALAGTLRYTTAEPQAHAHVLALAGQTAGMEGVIDAEPLRRGDQHVLRLRLRWLRAAETQTLPPDAAGLSIMIKTTDDGVRQWRYGDVIRCEGLLELPPRIGAFDYRQHLLRRGVTLWVPDVDHVQYAGHAPPDALWARLLFVKDALRKSIQRAVPAPESALLNGILIGDDDAMPARLAEAFRRTGASHVISISGFNVGVIVSAVVLLLGRFTHPRRFALLLIPLLWLYALFVGASASVVRAVAMTTLSLAGMLFWRRGFTVNTVCAAAFLLLCAQPFYLFDIGFQLSVSATLGLVLYADRLSLSQPPVQARTLGKAFPSVLTQLVGTIRDGITLTLAAQLTTLPLIALHFEQVSLVTLLTNALILPLQPPIMALGLGAGVIGLFLQDSAWLFALPVFALLKLTTVIVSETGAWSWSALPLPVMGWPAVCIYYAVLAALTPVLPALRCGGLALSGFRRKATPVLLACALCAVVFWRWSQPDGRTQAVFTGSSAVIRTAQGRTLVYVGDGDLSGVLQAVLPATAQTIDVLVLPRYELRLHQQALSLLRTFTVRQVWLPQPATDRDVLFDSWQRQAAQGSIRVIGVNPIENNLDELVLTPLQLAPDRLGNDVLGLRLTLGRSVLALFGSSQPSQAGSAGATLIFAKTPPIDGKSNTAQWVILTANRSTSVVQSPSARNITVDLSLQKHVIVTINSETVFIKAWTIY